MRLQQRSIHEHVVILLASDSDSDTVFGVRAYEIIITEFQYGIIRKNKTTKKQKKKKKKKKKQKKAKKNTLYEKKKHS